MTGGGRHPSCGFKQPAGDYSKEELAAIYQEVQSVKQAQIARMMELDEAEEEGQGDMELGSEEGEEAEGDLDLETGSDEGDEMDGGMAEEEAEEEGRRDEEGAWGRRTRSPQLAGVFDTGEPVFQSIEGDGEDEEAGSRSHPFIIS